MLQPGSRCSSHFFSVCSFQTLGCTGGIPWSTVSRESMLSKIAVRNLSLNCMCILVRCSLGSLHFQSGPPDLLPQGSHRALCCLSMSMALAGRRCLCIAVMVLPLNCHLCLSQRCTPPPPRPARRAAPAAQVSGSAIACHRCPLAHAGELLTISLIDTLVPYVSNGIPNAEDSCVAFWLPCGAVMKPLLFGLNGCRNP